jgi:hypothetical protein
MRPSILSLGLLSFHDMVLAVMILAIVFLAIRILNRLQHRRQLTRRVQRMLW